jgi:hypothetical protein
MHSVGDGRRDQRINPTVNARRALARLGVGKPPRWAAAKKAWTGLLHAASDRTVRSLPCLLGSSVMALLMAEPQALSSIFCRLCLCLERPCDLCGALGIGPVPTFGSLIHSAEEHADIRRQPFHSALVCCADLISAAYHVQCFAPSRSIAPQRFRASLCGVGWGGQNRPVRAAAALHPHQFRKV